MKGTTVPKFEYTPFTAYVVFLAVCAVVLALIFFVWIPLFEKAMEKLDRKRKDETLSFLYPLNTPHQDNFFDKIEGYRRDFD